MNSCYLCQQPFAKNDKVEFHHPIYKTKGGSGTAPTHKACHHKHHSTQGDFKEWGRIGGNLSALTRQWAFNLKHVKTNPAFENSRNFYLSFYAR
jgi:hypothetical protein